MSTKAKIEKKGKTEEAVVPAKSAPAGIGLFAKLAQLTMALTSAIPGKKKQGEARKVGPDPFVATPEVFGLPGPRVNKSDRPTEIFQTFLADKDSVMVFFYGDINSRIEKAKQIVRKAAQSTTRANHAYAAVDCSSQRDICIKEGIGSVPTFKLYSLGRMVGRFDEGVSAKDLKKFVETAPVPVDPPPVVKPLCANASRQCML